MKELPEEVRSDTIFVRDVPIEKIFVHYRTEPGGYARPLNQRRVKKLIDEFDSQALGLVLLSLREDGTYANIDGQHRQEAARAVGMTTLDAYVYIDLTVEEEARLYRKFGDYLKQSALDRYAAAQTEQEPETLAIDKMLAEAGLHVTRSGGPEVGGIQAVGAVLQIVKDFGPQVLRDTLALLKDAYGTKNARAYTTSVLQGAAQFIVRYRNDPKLQRQRLARKLAEEGISGLIEKSNAVRALDRSVAAKARYGQAIKAIHDAGLREENRLAPYQIRVNTPETKAELRKRMAEVALPAAVRLRYRKVADEAREVARCPRCRVEPGAYCKDVLGHVMVEKVHPERRDELRRVRRRVTTKTATVRTNGTT